MTENLHTIETRWVECNLPRVDRASFSISAWTSDEEIAAMAADREHVYGNRYDLDTEMRLFRAELRSAAMAQAAAGNRVLIQSVLDGGVDELVTAEATDEELSTIVTAAEAGYGKPILGLRRELELLRACERDDAA
ncbi:Uncharacterised protein [Mycobacteroides abscessus]|uniref:hypothetical protein n=1 Tax=Mycobacteroides abscessus TaxID=36809 RepID=UPI0005E33B05|nr:hypothetical protein [Mycobacteroides abscessus]CPS11026.1 Uncharacterised protein [Mycobacteroides abscessus]CPS50674.1 Uncharacterised protein [Mycobacteroides abscessus]CPS93501.1 Uncharacterised protein [Mycobacteroides abscessus]CPS94455.1 Uncharacterised protein [Mycobacteroides abscessus]CPT61522.1 Uncharacterised protein [Mycobacteroides abscessus]